MRASDAPARETAAGVHRGEPGDKGGAQARLDCQRQEGEPRADRRRRGETKVYNNG